METFLGIVKYYAFQVFLVLNKIFIIRCPHCYGQTGIEYPEKQFWALVDIRSERHYCKNCGWRHGYIPIKCNECNKAAFFIDERLLPNVEPWALYVIYPGGDSPKTRNQAYCHECGVQIGSIDVNLLTAYKANDEEEAINGS